MACLTVMLGFLSGVSGEGVGQTTSTVIAWGVWSSLTTAVETVVVKHFVSGPKLGIIDLVYTTAMATIPVYAVMTVLNGEYLQTISLGFSHPVFRKFMYQSIVAGLFNFALSTAAYLQIRVTSPTT